MISESGGGAFFPPGATGVTRLTDTGIAGATPLVPMADGLVNAGLALLTAACGNNPTDRALTGGAIGAGTGAVVGSTVGAPIAGAVVGGVRELGCQIHSPVFIAAEILDGVRKYFAVSHDGQYVVRSIDGRSK